MALALAALPLNQKLIPPQDLAQICEFRIIFFHYARSVRPQATTFPHSMRYRRRLILLVFYLLERSGEREKRPLGEVWRGAELQKTSAR